MTNQTVSLDERKKRAESLLDTFSKFTEYKHSSHNPYRRWLESNPDLTPEKIVKFLCFWYPVSKYQPQILLSVAASYPDWKDRKLIMMNYIEEDGMGKEGDEPHYDLLEKLIKKLGGKLEVDKEAEKLLEEFHKMLFNMTPAQATGFVAAIEHPALDISYYFNKIIELGGFGELLKTDIYLTIHVDVEPDHIIWSHGNALHHMQNGSKKDIVDSFQRGMSFWQEFWRLAFNKLNYIN